MNELSDPIDARITLASLLLEDGKRDEAISVLSPPENPGQQRKKTLSSLAVLSKRVHSLPMLQYLIKYHFVRFTAKLCTSNGFAISFQRRTVFLPNVSYAI